LTTRSLRGRESLWILLIAKWTITNMIWSLITLRKDSVTCLLFIWKKLQILIKDQEVEEVLTLRAWSTRVFHKRLNVRVMFNNVKKIKRRFRGRIKRMKWMIKSQGKVLLGFDSKLLGGKADLKVQLLKMLMLKSKHSKTE